MSIKHAVSLKVLRLINPSVQDTLLQLPHSFGTIYLSQYFTAFVSLKLEQNAIVLNPKLTLQFQSPSQLDSNSKTTLRTLNVDQLLPHSSQLDSIVHQQILQPGSHSLICTVSYEEPIPSDAISPDLQPPCPTQTRSFRKLYKFQALNPLVIHTNLIKFDYQKQEENQTEKLIQILNRLILIQDPESNQIQDRHDGPSSNARNEIITLFKDYLYQELNKSSCILEILIQNQALKPLDFNLKFVRSDSTLNENLNSRFKVTDLSNQLMVANLPPSTPTNILINPQPSSEQDHVLKGEYHKQETQPKYILPGDTHQYTFKLEGINLWNQRDIKIKKEKNDRVEEKNSKQAMKDEEEEEAIQLDIRFTGMMGESGRLTKSLSQIIKSCSTNQHQHQHHPSSLTTPSPGYKIRYINSGLHTASITNDHHDKSRSNGLFRFEITHLPPPNSIKIGSSIQIKFKISIDLKHDPNDDPILFNYLVKMLHLNLNQLSLSFLSNSTSTNKISQLVLLNTLPLQPILNTHSIQNTIDQIRYDDFVEFQLDYHILPLNNLIHQPFNKLDFNSYYLDLGHISTGSKDLNLLFNLPVHSIASVFCSP